MGNWVSGYLISGGDLEGSVIGVTNYIGGTPQDDFFMQQSEGYRNQTGDLVWYNTDFDKQIDITATLDQGYSPQGGLILAKMDITNNNAVVGRLVIKLLIIRADSFDVCGYIEDINGNNLGYVPRNMSSYTFGLNKHQTKRKSYLAFCVSEVGNAKYVAWGINMSSIQEGSGWLWGQRTFLGPCININHLSSMYGISGDLPEPEEKSPEFGKKAKKKGGYNPDHSRKGTFDDSSDKIEVSAKPYMGPFRTGFINGYVVTPTQLAHFAEAIFPEPGAFSDDLPKMIYDLMTSLINNKRVDYILDFLIVPVTPEYLSERTINCGGQPLWYLDDEEVYHTVKGNPIEDCFVDFNCGSLTIPEYWANFLDFSGSRFKLFLPYVGYVDIQPEFINGGELKVKYRFNVFDGSFMVYVISTSGHSELDESLIAQYAGVAAIHIPIQSQDYSNKISGLISSMGSLAAAGLTGGASMGVGAASSLANTMISKPGTTNANGYNASSSYLSHRKPYLIIERQSSQFSEKYPEERGLPLFIKATINDCRGLTVCDNPHLDTITATVEEKERIFKYLTEGIIV